MPCRHFAIFAAFALLLFIAMPFSLSLRHYFRFHYDLRARCRHYCRAAITRRAASHFQLAVAFIFIITPLFSRWLILRLHDDIFFLCHFSLFSDAYAYAIMPLTPPPCILPRFFLFC
jgi:hypothetical protein